jgi:hypothetical protein
MSTRFVAAMTFPVWGKEKRGGGEKRGGEKGGGGEVTSFAKRAAS